jgi:hypothetical protein
MGNGVISRQVDGVGVRMAAGLCLTLVCFKLPLSWLPRQFPRLDHRYRLHGS